MAFQIEDRRTREICAGLFSGVAHVVVFNPIDRGLYLSTIHGRSFLDGRNWEVVGKEETVSSRQVGETLLRTVPRRQVLVPLSSAAGGGTGQAMVKAQDSSYLKGVRRVRGLFQSGMWANCVSKVISYGLYFPVEDSLRRQWLSFQGQHDDNTPLRNLSLNGKLAIGQGAGLITGLLTNFLSLIKSQQWVVSSISRQQLMAGEERVMAAAEQATSESTKAFVRRFLNSEGKFAIFSRGLSATLLRNVSFGTGFALMRAALLPSSNQLDVLPESYHSLVFFGVSFTGGLFATAISSPFNYARSLQHAYGATDALPAMVGDKTGKRKKHLTIHKVLAELATTARNGRFRELAHRLRIGWGAVRVSGGIAFTEYVYNKCARDLLR